jgi:hypothetical protein
MQQLEIINHAVPKQIKFTSHEDGITGKTIQSFHQAYGANFSIA